MTQLRRLFLAFVIFITVATASVVIAQPAHAADPVPVITCDSYTVAVGGTLHCTVTETGGYTPTDKITWTNPRTHSTINVSNLAGQTFDVNYSPDAGEIGRNERLMATIGIPTYPGSRLVRLSSGSASFTVAPPAPSP